jgi:hypothetical protein
VKNRSWLAGSISRIEISLKISMKHPSMSAVAQNAEMN